MNRDEQCTWNASFTLESQAFNYTMLLSPFKTQTSLCFQFFGCSDLLSNRIQKNARLQGALQNSLKQCTHILMLCLFYFKYSEGNLSVKYLHLKYKEMQSTEFLFLNKVLYFWWPFQKSRCVYLCVCFRKTMYNITSIQNTA